MGLELIVLLVILLAVWALAVVLIWSAIAGAERHDKKIRAAQLAHPTTQSKGEEDD